MATRPYHHGNLRSALVDAAVELARERGPDAVVLREASRRVGVSHNAAYRHFADRAELLGEVAGRCMTALARLIERRVAKAPRGEGAEAERARLRASGAAYVEFALTEPGWFRAAFAPPAERGSFPPGTGVGDSGLGPFELLTERLDAFEAAGGFPPERRPLAEYAAWSTVHGLATLLTDGPLSGIPASERTRLMDRVFDSVERGL
jgi:AcrR family transcriptional regulator